MDLLIERCSHAQHMPLPHYATEHSAGLDLCACIEQEQLLEAGQYKLIPCGIKIALPPLTQAEIRPRSGLAFKHGITVLNSPGTIDADYRGEIKVLLINMSTNNFTILPKMRIAQMIIMPYIKASIKVSSNIGATERDQKGFGSTGLI